MTTTKGKILQFLVQNEMQRLELGKPELVSFPDCDEGDLVIELVTLDDKVTSRWRLDLTELP